MSAIVELTNLLLDAAAAGGSASADAIPASTGKQGDPAGSDFQGFFLKILGKSIASAEESVEVLPGELPADEESEDMRNVPMSSVEQPDEMSPDRQPSGQEADQAWAGQQPLEVTTVAEMESRQEPEIPSFDSERLLRSSDVPQGLPGAADAAPGFVSPISSGQVIEPPSDAPMDVPARTVPESRQTAVISPTVKTDQPAEMDKPASAEPLPEPARDDAAPEARRPLQVQEGRPLVADPPARGYILQSLDISTSTSSTDAVEERPGIRAEGVDSQHVQLPEPDKTPAWSPIEPSVRERNAVRVQHRFIAESVSQGDPAPPASPRESPIIGRPFAAPRELQGLPELPANMPQVESSDGSNPVEIRNRPDRDLTWMQMPEIRLPGMEAVSAVARSQAHLPPEHVIGSKLIHQIVQTARVHLFEGGAEMTLRLDPPHLGTLHMSVSAQQGAVTANLLTSTEVARQVLQADLPLLRHALAEAGINVDSINVSVGDSSNQGWMPGSGADDGRPSMGRGDRRLIPGLLDAEPEPGSPGDYRMLNSSRLDYLA